MSKLNWREVKKKKEMCRARDGDVCFVNYCMTGDEYRAKHSKDFDLHHIDENPENNEDDNLCLAAHKCNVGETPRGKGKFNRERIAETQKALKIREIRSACTQVQISKDEPPIVRYGELARSIEAKPIIEKELERIFELFKEVEKNDLKNAIANISGLSPERAKVRMDGWCNPINGHLVEFEKMVDGEKKIYIKVKSI